MKTFQQFEKTVKSIPTATSWYLADLGEAWGKQELFTKQSPQKLKVLREHALIESAVSSNRIEGVTVDQKRVGTIVFGNDILKTAVKKRSGVIGRHSIGFIRPPIPVTQYFF